MWLSPPPEAIVSLQSYPPELGDACSAMRGTVNTELLDQVMIRNILYAQRGSEAFVFIGSRVCFWSCRIPLPHTFAFFTVIEKLLQGKRQPPSSAVFKNCIQAVEAVLLIIGPLL